MESNQAGEQTQAWRPTDGQELAPANEPRATPEGENEVSDAGEMKIVVTPNGPYQVYGSVSLQKQTIIPNEEGVSWEWQAGEHYSAPVAYRLCRCGQSKHKPFCDNTHLRVGFDGTETASHAPYLEQAKVFEGPEMILTDAKPLCASARFCDAAGEIWNLIDRTDDPAAQELVAREASHCPSGRLVAWIKRTRQRIEPALEPSIGVVQDPAIGVSGGLWVRGGIPVIGSDGRRYEVRNRQTLCRCGASGNKPFCDGTHASIGFSDTR